MLRQEYLEKKLSPAAIVVIHLQNDENVCVN